MAANSLDWPSIFQFLSDHVGDFGDLNVYLLSEYAGNRVYGHAVYYWIHNKQVFFSLPRLARFDDYDGVHARNFRHNFAHIDGGDAGYDNTGMNHNSFFVQ